MTKDAKPDLKLDPRQVRLAKALRDNLKRRREQAKRRAQAPAEAAEHADPVVKLPQTPMKQRD